MNTEQLLKLEEELVFTQFTNEDALQLGLELVKNAKENGKSVAVHIERNRIPLFTHLMDGTSEENVKWLYRKKNVVDHYNHSTQFIAARFEESGLTHQAHSLLPVENYQAVGGSLPIRINGVGVIGTVTVAGLTPQMDHDYAVAGVKRFLGNK
ncbi:heme-degrading domain-containing protein [Bacillus sp. RAR_GA_16]|uniref:heme-degrading domain-containing protein n=1 Tax=Bacillus sp. RAR_GA_16 TaxID=2876774 RepID=UPI001CC94143|nr:heme-degrading domain-containing protein [Bacillus sp. RAR_GA_16]MCA0171209.1 heme-degrading domain-containing protein [Bacillus sp. RAR_GA_16]